MNNTWREQFINECNLYIQNLADFEATFALISDDLQKYCSAIRDLSIEYCKKVYDSDADWDTAIDFDALKRKLEENQNTRIGLEKEIENIKTELEQIVNSDQYAIEELKTAKTTLKKQENKRDDYVKSIKQYEQWIAEKENRSVFKKLSDAFFGNFSDFEAKEEVEKYKCSIKQYNDWIAEHDERIKATKEKISELTNRTKGVADQGTNAHRMAKELSEKERSKNYEIERLAEADEDIKQSIKEKEKEFGMKYSEGLKLYEEFICMAKEFNAKYRCLLEDFCSFFTPEIKEKIAECNEQLYKVKVAGVGKKNEDFAQQIFFKENYGLLLEFLSLSGYCYERVENLSGVHSIPCVEAYQKISLNMSASIKIIDYRQFNQTEDVFLKLVLNGDTDFGEDYTKVCELLEALENENVPLGKILFEDDMQEIKACVETNSEMDLPELFAERYGRDYLVENEAIYSLYTEFKRLYRETPEEVMATNQRYEAAKAAEHRNRMAQIEQEKNEMLQGEIRTREAEMREHNRRMEESAERANRQMREAAEEERYQQRRREMEAEKERKHAEYRAHDRCVRCAKRNKCPGGIINCGAFEPR